ncbi:hypothetical protein KCV03_g10254, partial [Aureobasidium melanogenum]
MHLSNLVKEDSMGRVSTELRRTIYFVRLLYLGALMLLNRRIAIQSSCIDPNAKISTCSDVSVSKLADDSTMAAEQSARILGLLLDEEGIFERCWIFIVDHVARKSEKTLRPCHATLRAAHDKPSSRFVPELKKMEAELYHLVLLPFDRIRENDFACNQADDTGIALHSRTYYEDFEKSTLDRQQMSAYNTRRPDSLAVDTIVKNLQPAYALEGFSTCGWY